MVTVWPIYPVHVYVCRRQFALKVLAIKGYLTHRTSHSFVALHLVVSAFVHETYDLFCSVYQTHSTIAMIDSRRKQSLSICALTNEH